MTAGGQADVHGVYFGGQTERLEVAERGQVSEISMTPDEFVSIFNRHQTTPDSLEVHQLPLDLMLRKPTNLDYLVSGLMDKDDRAEIEKWRMWKRKAVVESSLVSHNFRYRMYGTAVGPESCFEQDCELAVNTVGLEEYRHRESTGTIGGGVFAGEAFQLTLDVAPEIAKNVIQRRLLAPEVEQGYQEDEDKGSSTTWMRLSLDILSVRKQSDDRVFFSIGRAYFSSTFSVFQFY